MRRVEEGHMLTPILKAAFGSAALFSVMLIAATERDPPRPHAAIPDAITDRWPEPEPLRKTDRLALPPVPAGGPAMVVPAVAPPLLPAPHDDPKPARTERRHRHASGDVCTRHGMRKVVTRGGRSWRCRRTA
jgi:hypothetical protein